MFLRKPFKYSYFHASLILILINLVFFITIRFSNMHISILSLNTYNVIRAHCYWQFITYMFTHYSFSHFFFNMLALAMFGVGVERAIGSKEFLLMYFVCGILSGALSFCVYLLLPNNGMNVFLMGASGAIYGILFAYAVCYPRSILSIWGIIPVPAPILVLIYAIIAIVDEIFVANGVSNITHLFGFAVAWLYFLIRMGVRPLKIWINSYK